MALVPMPADVHGIVLVVVVVGVNVGVGVNVDVGVAVGVNQLVARAYGRIYGGRRFRMAAV